MGLIRTMGKFCYVECDTQNCTKKMEHIDEKLLRQLAGLCGWERRGNQWICPNCAEHSSRRPAGASGSRRKTRSSSEK